MSGKYLHGLIIDGDFVDANDNIFSHSELRQKWTGAEQKHNSIQEWSWDFVTREFIETEEELIPIAEQWIKKNLSNHNQLIVWVEKNWHGLVNGDEREREQYIWGLINHKATHKNKLVFKFLTAFKVWKNADSDLKNAKATWQNATWKNADSDLKNAKATWQNATWKNAYAAWYETGVARTNAEAALKNAKAAWQKAEATWKNADSTWKNAYAAWKTDIMRPVFMDLLRKYPNKYWEEK